MNLETPDLQNISEYKWNSNIHRDEIVRQNTSRWQSDLVFKQPLMLFGKPTNGFFSLNYRTYRYLQKDEGENELDYYNRLYLKFEQPLFLANELKYDLEEAELNLKDVKLEYYSELLDIMGDISDDYFDIFEQEYENVIYNQQLEFLGSVKSILNQDQTSASDRDMEHTQVDLEISNVHENILSNKSDLRGRYANLKMRLNLSDEDSVFVLPEIWVRPININLEQAIHFGFTNNPQLKRLDIRKRKSEIDVENEKSDNAFHMVLEMTYGIEKKDERIKYLWQDVDNSNSITLNAYLPLWDGGQRKRNIQAEQLNLAQDELRIKEERQDIEKDIINSYRDLTEYSQRLINLTQSIELSNKLTTDTIEKYKTSEIALESLLQIITRTRDTQAKFLDVYIDYKRSMLELMEDTYYDFDNNISLLEKFE